MSQISELQQLLRDFAERRQWEKYHTAKNLVMAIAAEAGELLAEFEWLTPQESMLVMADATKAHAVTDEIADVAIYLLRLADVLSVDLESAVRAKTLRNEGRFRASSEH
jgi:NTP pyrophosphatase (non-canonical NTP hydrolase)